MFALSPVIQEGESVLFESYARIKHLATRTWLHLDKSESEVNCGVGSVVPATYCRGLPLAYLGFFHFRVKGFNI